MPRKTNASIKSRVASHIYLACAKSNEMQGKANRKKANRKQNIYLAAFIACYRKESLPLPIANSLPVALSRALSPPSPTILGDERTLESWPLFSFNDRRADSPIFTDTYGGLRFARTHVFFVAEISSPRFDGWFRSEKFQTESREPQLHLLSN